MLPHTDKLSVGPATLALTKALSGVPPQKRSGTRLCPSTGTVHVPRAWSASLYIVIGCDELANIGVGEGRVAAKIEPLDVCRNLVADWPVARTAPASVSGGEVICDERRRQRSALMRAKATSSSASAQSSDCFDRLLRTRRAFTVA